MAINYHNKKFKPLSLTENSSLDSSTIFHYTQMGDIVQCSYSGGTAIQGHLIGIVDQNGTIDMRYHQVNDNGELMTGICHSTPHINVDGKITLHEKWQWTSGDKSSGQSKLVEI